MEGPKKRKGKTPLPRVRPHEKVCATCKETKSYLCFTKVSRRHDLLDSNCKDCRNKIFAEYREANREKLHQRYVEHKKNNPEAVAKAHRKTKLKQYALTPERYDSILVGQEGKCSICRRLPHPDQRLAVDHCHTTGQVRGLLCFKCNQAIGALDECPERIFSAIEYLYSAEAVGCPLRRGRTPFEEVVHVKKQKPRRCA